MLSYKAELSIVVLIQGEDGGDLVALVASILCQTSFPIHGIIFAILTDPPSARKDCVGRLSDVAASLGLDAQICEGNESCFMALQQELKAGKKEKLIVIHESVVIGCKSLSLLLGVSKHLAGSMVLPTLFSSSGSLVFGLKATTAPPKTDLDLYYEQSPIGVHQVIDPPFAAIIGAATEVLLTILNLLSSPAHNHLGLRMKASMSSHFVLLDHAVSILSDKAVSDIIWPPFQPEERRKLLYVDTNIPTPDKDSGSKRTFALMSILIGEGVEVHFQPLWPFEEKYKVQLEAIGVKVLTAGYSDSWIVEPWQDYSIVVIARRFPFEYSQTKVKITWPRAKLVYDTVDLHFLREARVKMTDAVTLNGATDLDAHTSTSKVIKWLSSGNNADDHDSKAREEVNRVRELELSFVLASDLTLVVSEAEVEVIKHYLPKVKVALVSNIMSGREAVDEEEKEMDGERHQNLRDQFEERSGFLFVGHMVHFPNQQAVRALVDTIIPEVKRRVEKGSWGTGEVERDLQLAHKRPLPCPIFHIVGSGSLPDDLREAVEQEKGIVYHGELSDAQLGFLYSSVKASLAPLVTGAGVKGKVNQAMSLGVPVVATSVAVEGMHVRPGEDCMVSSSLSDFVDHLEKVDSDYELWMRLAVSGRSNVRAYFSIKVARNVVRGVLKDLQ